MKAYHIDNLDDKYPMVRTGWDLATWRTICDKMRDGDTPYEAWEPPLGIWLNEQRPMADSMVLGGAYGLLLFLQRAKRAKSAWKLMEEAGEFLPIKLERYGLALVWRPLHTLVCAHEGASEFHRCGDGRLLGRLVLDRTKIGSYPLFRVDEDRGRVICLEEKGKPSFKSDVEACGITGLKFVEVPIK